MSIDRGEGRFDQFDRSDPTLGLEPRAASPEFVALCDDLLVDVGRKHRCSGCGGSFWVVADLERHAPRCGQ